MLVTCDGVAVSVMGMGVPITLDKNKARMESPFHLRRLERGAPLHAGLAVQHPHGNPEDYPSPRKKLHGKKHF